MPGSVTRGAQQPVGRWCTRVGARMNAKEWIATYAQRLGTDPPTVDQWRTILDLAGEAAHSSERVAAPVACWVAATAGVDLDRALAVARELAGADGDAGAGD